MDQNPYQSPQSSPEGRKPLDPQWRVFAARRRPRPMMSADRPMVVTVICFLQLICIPLQMLLLFGTSVDLIIAGIERAGLSPGIMLGIALASWGLGMISALGMLSGAKWGWWSGAFFYAYSILRTLFALAHLALLAQRNFIAGQTLAFNVLWLVVRIPIMALILILFFSDDFRAYFGLSPERKLRAGAGTALAAVVAEAVEIGVLYLMRT